MRHETELQTFVVADRFANFAKNTSVITLGALNGLLASGHCVGDRPVALRPGLGVGPEDWAQLRALVHRCGGDPSVTASGAPGRPLPGGEVLKADQDNVLLADLRRTGPVTYRADLVVTRDSEMILDHTAERQHVPGMLLMEACCQMLIAATRQFLRQKRPGRHYYSVMQHFEIEFRRFVFPLPAYLELTVEAWDEQDRERPSFTSTISINQGGRVCSQARWRYRAFPPARLFTAEAAQARSAISACNAGPASGTENGQ